MRKSSNNEGYLLIGALISVVLFVMVTVSLFSPLTYILVRSERSRSDSEASLILQEGIEVAYNVLMSDWKGYGEGEYYPAVAYLAGREVWAMMPGREDGVRTKYSRWVELEKVCRRPKGSKDAGEIVSCGEGEVDENSQVVRGVVEWKEKGEEKRIEAELLVINI